MLRRNTDNEFRILESAFCCILALMPSVYVDHNFVVGAYEGPVEYKEHLRQLSATGAVTFVLSPNHWVEMAEDENAQRGIDVADFADSLRPRWLYERRAVQEREVAHAFFRFARIPSEQPQMITSMREVIADLAGRAADRDSRAFVINFRTVGPDHPLEKNIERAFEANQANGIRFRAGELTPAMVRDAERRNVQELLPVSTPNGVLIDTGSKNEFLNTYQLAEFPSFALEVAATHDNWSHSRQLSRNNFIDQQHVMAIPYVDLFVTDDRGFRNLIARIVVGVPFRTATVLTKAEFDSRFRENRA